MASPEFQMEFPCVIGHKGRYLKSQVRYTWLRTTDREIRFGFEREKATQIQNMTQALNLLRAIALVGSPEGVFVEPLTESKP